MWQNQVNVVRQALADRQANTHLKVNAVLQIIEKTAFIENVLAASMSPGMAASLDWSRGVQLEIERMGVGRGSVLIMK